MSFNTRNFTIGCITGVMITIVMGLMTVAILHSNNSHDLERARARAAACAHAAPDQIAICLKLNP